MTEVLKYVAPKTLGHLVSVEFDANYCRENGVLLAGSGSVRSVPQFAVLGQNLAGAVTSAPKGGGNTGNGTFVLDVTTPGLVGVKVGVYSLRCITAVTNGGVFRLEDPDGFVAGDYTITPGAGGTVTVNDDIKGVLTDGGTDFVVGDGFDVTVAAGTGKYVQLDLTGLKGEQIAAGIAIDVATAADGVDDVIALLRRGPMLVRSDELVWPAGATAPQIATGLAQLEARGIVARVSG
jgi:hypothetical protein